jgi:hypothetical protein
VSDILSVWFLIHSTSPTMQDLLTVLQLGVSTLFRYVISLFAINSITTPSELRSYLDRIAMVDSHLWQTYYTVKTVRYM